MFKNLLMKLGCVEGDLADIGCHSLKTTCLSWTAKHGVPKETRKLLGYHVGSEDKSMECYSRDSMSDPLRALDKVIGAIGSGSFAPDMTRSGMWTESSTPASGAEAAEEASPSPSSSSSSSSSASLSYATGTDVTDTIDYSGKLLINNATRFVHIIDDVISMRCGKPWPDDHELVADIPPRGMKCPGCF